MCNLVSVIGLWLATMGGATPSQPPALKAGLCLTGIAGGPIVSYSLSPESQVAVVVRDQRRPQLLYIDLARGVVRGRRDVLDLLPGLAVAPGGRLVAVIDKVEERNTAPATISLWRPEAEPASAWKTFSEFVVAEAGGTTTRIAPEIAAQPRFSPDGRQLAFIGYLMNDDPMPQARRVNDPAVGILDVETGKTRAIRVPVDIGPRTPRSWQVAWGADGDEVYALLHGDYVAVVPAENAPPGTRVFVPATPDLGLYRIRLSEMRAEFVSVTPKSTVGFDGYGGVVIRDGIDGYRRIPVDAFLSHGGSDRDSLARLESMYPVEQRVTRGSQGGSVWVSGTRSYVVTRATERETPCAVYVEVRTK